MTSRKRRLGIGVLLLAVLAASGLVLFPKVAQRKDPGNSPERRRLYRAKFEAQENRLQVAREAWHAGRLAEAERTFREVFYERKDGYTAYELGLILRDAGKPKEAERFMHYVAHPDSRHGFLTTDETTVFVQYAEVCKQAGDAAESEWALKKSGARDWFDAYMIAGDAIQWDNYREQARLYHEALKIKPDNVAAKRGYEMAVSKEQKRVEEGKADSA